MPSYMEIVEKRRNLRADTHKTLADVGFDGPWVTPYQKISRSQTGPVLVAWHWLDEDGINLNRSILESLGYLPGLRFNNVIDIALDMRRLKRNDIYVTQAFHLVPISRSERILPRLVDSSFGNVTRHELSGRKVLALGSDVASACRRHNVRAVEVCHPSRRGYSNEANAAEIAEGLAKLGF